MTSDFLVWVLAGVLAGVSVYAFRLRQKLARQDRVVGELYRKSAEQQTLVEDQAVLKAFRESGFDALLVLDKDCRVVAVNRVAETLFGVKNVAGKKLIETIPIPELRMIAEAALANDGEPFEEQFTLGERSYRGHARVIDCGGLQYIGVAVQDITQLVKLNRARRDMVANISHELRTPIANIRLIIDGLFHDHDKPKRKDSISSLKAIARETDSLLWLVQEMADLSMIESGQAIVRMYETLLHELVEQAIERIADQSEAKHLKIVRDIPKDLRVLCDQDLTKRVLINLIHNAVKWSPPGETITIGAVNGAEEVTISVWDNGPGVPEGQTERIFERFYQVDPSRSSHEGTGLGLAICKHIVKAHGGRIWAESNKNGNGGRFFFTLLSAGHHESDRTYAVEGTFP